MEDLPEAVQRAALGAACKIFDDREFYDNKVSFYVKCSVTGCAGAALVGRDRHVLPPCPALKVYDLLRDEMCTVIHWNSFGIETMEGTEYGQRYAESGRTLKTLCFRVLINFLSRGAEVSASLPFPAAFAVDNLLQRQQLTSSPSSLGWSHCP